jgi:hypothetical protein
VIVPVNHAPGNLEQAAVVTTRTSLKVSVVRSTSVPVARTISMLKRGEKIWIECGEVVYDCDPEQSPQFGDISLTQ